MRDAREIDALVAKCSQRTAQGKPAFIGFSSRLSAALICSWCFAGPELQLYARKVEKDDEARSAALSLLARGMITPGQAAVLAGVSRQLVGYWLRHAGIDWRLAWERRQAGMWRREIAALNGKVMRPPSKRFQRREAERLKRQFDAKPR